jgi:hypothetical protein
LSSIEIRAGTRSEIDGTMALLRYGLARADEQAMLAFLETGKPSNIPLYERSGFEVLAEVPNADGSVSTYPMLRPAR